MRAPVAGDAGLGAPHHSPRTACERLHNATWRVERKRGHSEIITKTLLTVMTQSRSTEGTSRAKVRRTTCNVQHTPPAAGVSHHTATTPPLPPPPLSPPPRRRSLT